LSSWSAALCVLAVGGNAFGQSADLRLVALTSPGASDTITTLPASESFLLDDAPFVVELWAQTTHVNGLSSVSADMTFTAALANVTGITHPATFNVLTHAMINNATGSVDDLSGSHLGACTDALGASPNWARVAILDALALGGGSLTFQSGPTGSAVYGTAICGVGDVPDAQITFGAVTVTLVECLVDTDCDDGQYCNGAETCNLTTHTCQAGTGPTCDDQIDCTDDDCDPQADGGAGACVNVPNHAHCTDSVDCTVDACDQLGAPGTGCSYTPNHAACDDEIGCTDDICDQLGTPGTGCSNTPNPTYCDDLITCTADACDQLTGPGTGCSNSPNDAVCSDSIDCTIDRCDQLAAPGSGCSYTPDHSYCDDLVACTDDACDLLAAPGTGCSNIANDAHCDDGLFCDGFETCDAIQGCLNGEAPCTAECEHCVEDGDSCAWCVFDLDGSGVMGTGDFSFFSSCFGACYPPADPCQASNFDEDVSGCVGTSDFAAFVGCFGGTCGSCAGCAGPGGGAAAGGASMPAHADDASVRVRVIPRHTASAIDVAQTTPLPDSTFVPGDTMFVEIWARIEDPNQSPTAGFASAYVDLGYDHRRMAVLDVVPSGVLDLLVARMSTPTKGVLWTLGGCAGFGSIGVGGGGEWVRVSTVVTRLTAPGRVDLAVGPSDKLHGFARVGMFQNVDPSRIEFERTAVQIRKNDRDSGRR
jgi:hypothetical protein